MAMSKQQQPKVVILREHDAEPTDMKSDDVAIRIVPKKEKTIIKLRTDISFRKNRNQQ